MRLGLYRCAFDAGGTSYAGVLVFNTADQIALLVGERMFSRIDLERVYPGASNLEFLGPAVMAPVGVDPLRWHGLTDREKAAVIYRALDEHEVRS